MKIHEYLAKGTLSFYGINIPSSRFYETYIEESCPFLPCVLKSQVLVGSRMKNGGVLFAKSQNEFEKSLKTLLKKTIRGENPSGVLAERMLEIREEYYVSLIMSREHRDIVLCFSDHGGINVEENSETVRSGCFEEIIDSIPAKLRDVIYLMRDAFQKEDMTYLEINPLAVLRDESVYALDCVMDLDENAFFRKKASPVLESREREENDFHFVGLDGDIGIVGCGAGIVMATMDAVRMYGGEPADFLDIGGGAGRETTICALKKLYGDGQRKILLNIFGGITSCDEVALAITSFVQEHGDARLFIRMAGNKSEQAKAILENSGISTYDNLYEMVEDCLKAGDEYALR